MADYTVRQWALDKALEAHRQSPPAGVDAAKIVSTAETFLAFAESAPKA
jgi:hypothetical protein